jgi:hypothetical protein
MRISIVGPNSQIPPTGWGAVESLIWDMKNNLSEMGHEIQIINVGDPFQIVDLINNFSPDFVHINYDDWIPIYPYIQYPCAITTHFAYINRPELMGGYKQRVFDFFTDIKPNVFGLSKSINEIYNSLCGIPEEKLYLNPNGVAHPLVCLEAFSAGLGVVISEWAAANLDTTKNFITIIPEDKISNITYVEEKIIENRKYSVENREEILDYAKTFDWKVILESYYIPNIEKLIYGQK